MGERSLCTSHACLLVGHSIVQRHPRASFSLTGQDWRETGYTFLDLYSLHLLPVDVGAASSPLWRSRRGHKRCTVAKAREKETASRSTACANASPAPASIAASWWPRVHDLHASARNRFSPWWMITMGGIKWNALSWLVCWSRCYLVAWLDSWDGCAARHGASTVVQSLMIEAVQYCGVV